MIPALYQPFQKWAETGTVWIYSDPHFSDEEMKYLRKNYIGDEEQIRRINSKVGKKDTLIILGDVGNIECVKKLRGYKVLVMGNHDTGAANYLRQRALIFETNDLNFARESKALGKIDNIVTIHATEEDVTYQGWQDNHLFDEVYDGPLFISEKVLLSHEPIVMSCAYNLHGHDHSGWYNPPGFQHKNLCAEHINYTPVNLTALYKNGFASKVETIHRMTIDAATVRKAEREAKGKKKGEN